MRRVTIYTRPKLGFPGGYWTCNTGTVSQLVDWIRKNAYDNVIHYEVVWD